jgi:RNA polymerase-binding transcription factor DksA
MDRRHQAAAHRQRLLTLLRRLARDRSQLRDEALQGVGGEANGGLSDLPLHPADFGSLHSGEDVTLTLLESEEQIIAAINDALERLAAGTFGRCAACGREIAPARLRAVPYTPHCVTCARRQRTAGEAEARA